MTRPEPVEGSCRQARRLLSVRREWTGQDQVRVTRHLAGCPACQAIARYYELMDLRLGRLPQPARALALPADVQMRTIAQDRIAETESVSWPLRTLQGVALVAILALVTVAVLVWQNPRQVPVPVVHDREEMPSAFLAPSPGPNQTQSEARQFLWPASGYVSQAFSSDHPAVDIANHLGTPVQAAAAGTVLRVGKDDRHGIHVLVDHGGGYTTFYSHLDVAHVPAGAQVEKGHKIGLMGSTGLSTGPHLHFEVRQDGMRVNPFELIASGEWIDKLTPVPSPAPGARPVGSDAGRFEWPAVGYVTQGYSDEHPALDIANRVGTPIYAAAGGVVAALGRDTGHGRYALVDHGDGHSTFYSHLHATRVKTGERLARGQKIGEMGNTGFTTGPHLHFEVRREGVPIDPFEVLPELSK